MYTNEQVCEQIRTVLPDIGECGIDLNVQFSKENNAWEVDLKKGNRHLRTFLETQDADQCLEGRQCVGLGVQIHQLRDNIKSMRFS